MNEDELKFFISYCKTYAAMKGFSNDAEDFAQIAAMKRLGGRRANIEQLFIDYLRETYGDPRVKTYRMKQSERLYFHAVNRKVIHQLDSSTLSEYFQANSKKQSIDDLDQGFKDYLTQKESSFLFLLQLGYYPKEIAEILNVSETRAGQIRKNIIRKIKSYLDFKDGKILHMRYKRIYHNF